MRPGVWFSFLACLAAFLGACREAAHAPPKTSTATVAATADSLTFHEKALAELAALREEVTPAQWLREHPADSLVPFSLAETHEPADPWCVRVTRRDTLRGATPILRHAYFYPPTPRESLELPPDDEASDLAVRTCRLGAIWVEAHQADSAAGHKLAVRTREALQEAYGPVTAGGDAFLGKTPTDSQQTRLRALPFYETMSLGIMFPGSAAWRAPGRWQRGPVTIVSAFDDAFGSLSRRRVLAFAYLPHSTFDLTQRIRDAFEEPPDSTLEVAVQLSGLDLERIEAFLAHRSDSATGSTRVMAIQAWLTAAGDLDPGRRAAALLVADGVVPEYLDPTDHVSRDAYATLGLRFVHSELGGSYNYAHGLLEEAFRLDSAGPVGELAMTTMLERGLDLTGMCGGGFEEVIAIGEPFLARVRTPALRARVLFTLADAYADIVALAAGANPDYADPAEFAPRAPEARRKALAYYRQGLALDRASERAREAWSRAWRLVADLPPTGTRFFCVYD